MEYYTKSIGINAYMIWMLNEMHSVTYMITRCASVFVSLKTYIGKLTYI